VNVKLVLASMLCLLSLGTAAQAQTKDDEAALQRLPEAFRDAFNTHDGQALAAIMADDVDFVTVGLTWFQGRPDFEKYHTRLLRGRFKEISYAILQTHVRFIRPDVAVVRHSWTVKGDKNVDGSDRPQRFGMMTMVAEKRGGTWLVAAAQNVNAPVGETAVVSPETEDIKPGPIVIPRVR
jgi:uncharacterized protein (TIGR02246 family)